MGTNYSSQQVKTTTKVINDSLSKVVTDINNRTDTNIRTDQSVVVDMEGASLKGCPVTVSQNANLAANVMMQATNQVSSDLSTDILTSVQDTISQSLDQVNEDLNLGQTNVAKVQSDANEYVETNIQSIVENSINNIMSVSAGGGQNILFKAKYLTCNNSPITLTQDLTIDTVAQNVSQSILEQVVSNTSVSDVVSEVDQQVSQKNAGLNLGILFLILIVGGVIFLLMKFAPGGTSSGSGSTVMSKFKNLSTSKKMIILFAGFLIIALISLAIYVAVTGNNPLLPNSAK